MCRSCLVSIGCLIMNQYPMFDISIFKHGSRLLGQTCKFFKFLLSLNSQKRLRHKESNTKYRGLTWKPRSHVRILIYRTWPIALSLHFTWLEHFLMTFVNSDITMSTHFTAGFLSFSIWRFTIASKAISGVKRPTLFWERKMSYDDDI